MSTNNSLADTHLTFIQPSSYILLPNGDFKRRRNKLNYTDIYIEKLGYTDIRIFGRRGKRFISKTVNLGKGKKLSNLLLEIEKRKLNLSEIKKNKNKSLFSINEDEENENKNNLNEIENNKININKNKYKDNKIRDEKLKFKNDEFRMSNYNIMKERYNIDNYKEKTINRNKNKILLLSKDESITLRKFPNDLSQFLSSSNILKGKKNKNIKKRFINFNDFRFPSNDSMDDNNKHYLNDEKPNDNKNKNIKKIKNKEEKGCILF